MPAPYNSLSRAFRPRVRDERSRCTGGPRAPQRRGACAPARLQTWRGVQCGGPAWAAARGSRSQRGVVLPRERAASEARARRRARAEGAGRCGGACVEEGCCCEAEREEEAEGAIRLACIQLSASRLPSSQHGRRDDQRHEGAAVEGAANAGHPAHDGARLYSCRPGESQKAARLAHVWADEGARTSCELLTRVAESTPSK